GRRSHRPRNCAERTLRQFFGAQPAIFAADLCLPYPRRCCLLGVTRTQMREASISLPRLTSALVVRLQHSHPIWEPLCEGWSQRTTTKLMLANVKSAPLSALRAGFAALLITTACALAGCAGGGNASGAFAMAGD